MHAPQCPHSCPTRHTTLHVHGSGTPQLTPTAGLSPPCPPCSHVCASPFLHLAVCQPHLKVCKPQDPGVSALCKPVTPRAPRTQHQPRCPSVSPRVPPCPRSRARRARLWRERPFVGPAPGPVPRQDPVSVLVPGHPRRAEPQRQPPASAATAAPPPWARGTAGTEREPSGAAPGARGAGTGAGPGRERGQSPGTCWL